MSKVVLKKLLETSSSWDGVKYNNINGIPYITITETLIPPYKKLSWHIHEIPEVAYVIKGKLIIEKKNGMKKIINQGEAFAEVVNDLHRGVTEGDGATVLSVYIGTEDKKNTSISIEATNYSRFEI